MEDLEERVFRDHPPGYSGPRTDADSPIQAADVDSLVDKAA